MADPGELRDRMVDEIQRMHPDCDDRVLDAMRRVPRHVFIEHVDVETAHDVARAIVVPGFDPERITTSVSAPNLVAWMLHELHLEPGLRVLEIGAGSGYNAALLAELGCIVTTVDIDPTLIDPARRRLADVGHGGVVVEEGDGDAGFAPRAPFDRIVATVGCNDLAPAWFDQLAPDGSMLVPLRHGAGQPIVRAGADHTSLTTGWSGFVRMLGTQDVETVWDRSGADASVPRDDFDALYFLALRAVAGPPAGIAELLEEWRTLGRPGMSSFRSTWVPRGTGDGRWVVPRVHHDQVVELVT